MLTSYQAQTAGFMGDGYIACVDCARECAFPGGA